MSFLKFLPMAPAMVLLLPLPPIPPEPPVREIGQQIPVPLKAIDGRIPNHTTREALDQSYRGEGLTRYADLDALKKALA